MTLAHPEEGSAYSEGSSTHSAGSFGTASESSGVLNLVILGRLFGIL